MTEKLRDPHRTTLAWLNENTPESYGFFGVEIEALTIDGSRPAVRFNVIVRPNNWQRRAARRNGDGPLTEEQIWLQRYWTSFAAFLDDVGASDWKRELPRDRYWGGKVGRPGFRIFGIVNRKEQLLQVQLDVRHSELERIIGALEAQRTNIESQIGCPLEWRRKPESLQIATQTHDLDPNDETQWRRQHDWLLGRIKAFRAAFKDRTAELAGGPSTALAPSPVDDTAAQSEAP